MESEIQNYLYVSYSIISIKLYIKLYRILYIYIHIIIYIYIHELYIYIEKIKLMVQNKKTWFNHSENTQKAI